MIDRRHTRRRWLRAVLGAAASGAAIDLLAGAEAVPRPLELPPLEGPDEWPPSPAVPQPERQRVGFAVVGIGHLSLEQILPAFGQSKSARLAAVVSGDPQKAQAVVERYAPKAKIYDYQTFDRLRDDAEVKAVYVVLPNALHAEYTVRAAQAGKHVLCEKPMATNVADCDRMIAACRTAGVQLMIAYRMQYEPYNRTAIRLARENKLGALRAFSAENVQDMGEATQWRLKRALSGGGCLPDVGIYCLNAARYLTGEEPSEVTGFSYATPGDPRFKEVEETFGFMLRFPSGLLANCLSGYGSHRSQRYRLMGVAGWLELNPAFPYQGLRLETGHKSAFEGAEERSDQHWSERSQFARELDHFAQCVTENRQPRTPGEEGRQDLRLIEALYLSGREGRSVKLSPVPGKDVYRGPALSEG